MYYQQRPGRMPMPPYGGPMPGRPGMGPGRPGPGMGYGAGMPGYNVPPRRPAPFVANRAPVAGRGAAPARGAGQRFPQGVGEVFLPFLQVDRKLPELCRRYPKLYYSPDMTRALCHWVEVNEKIDLPITGTGNLKLDAEKSVQLPDSYAVEPNPEEQHGDRYFARVILLAPKPEEPEEERKPEDGPKPPKVPVHPWQRYRFILALNAKGHRVPYGGEWSAEDGQDPTNTQTLINTAIRLTKEQSGVDLSSVTQWFKIVETQYRRKNGSTDRSFFFLPDTWSIDLQAEAAKGWANEYRQEVEEVEEVEEEGEGEAKQVITKKVQRVTTKASEKVILTPIETSLQTLVEQNTHETGEPTVESSLFACAIDEILGLKYANKLLAVLRKKKVEADEAAQNLKRKRDDEAAEREVQQKKAIEEMEAKRRKVQEDNAAREAWVASRREEEKDMPEDEIQRRRQEEVEKEEDDKRRREEEAKLLEEEARIKKEEEVRKKAEEEEAKKRQQEEEDRARGYSIVKTTHTLVDEEIAAPFQYFDRPSFNTPGQLRRDTLEGVLHALGSLTQREIEGLLRGVGLPPDRPTGPLFYRRLAGYQVTEEKMVPFTTPAEGEAPAADGLAPQGDVTMFTAQ